MNTALQCLLSTTELTHFFLRGFYKKELNVNNPLGHKGEVAESFSLLVDAMHAHTEKWALRKNHLGTPVPSFEPTHFKRSISELNDRMFSGYLQQDSQELLGAVLDAIHEDCNRILRKPYVENHVGDGKNDTADAQIAWDRYKLRNDSFVVDTFQGQMRSRVTCTECHNMSVSFDPSMYLSVAFRVVVPPSSLRVVVKFESPSMMRPLDQLLFDDLPQGFHHDCDVKVLTEPTDTFGSLVKRFEDRSPGFRFVAVTFMIPRDGICMFDMLVPVSANLPMQKAYENYVILEMPPLVADAWIEADRLSSVLASSSTPASTNVRPVRMNALPPDEASDVDSHSSDNPPAQNWPGSMPSLEQSSIEHAPHEQTPGLRELVSLVHICLFCWCMISSAFLLCGSDFGK
jgi:hypothetical protein